jgi:hypothetical protein
MSGLYKKEKKDILGKLEQLDKKAESTLLRPHELNIKQSLNAWLIQLLREEEIKWYQRSKSNRLLQGDSNMKYFHMVANGKHKKSQIFELLDGDRTIREMNHLSLILRTITKNLFYPSDGGHFSLEEDGRSNITQISLEDNEKLTSIFTEQEVKEAIFQMRHDKEPRPNDFLAKFYQIF